MIVPGNNLSDDSDDDMDNAVVDPYRRKYQLISERCEVLQQDNERLVYRIQQVRKELRKAKKERKFVLDRLDTHADGWRNVPMTLPMADEANVRVQVKTEKPSPGKGSPAAKNVPSDKQNRKSVGQKRKSTAKGDKSERDPNAPKRPANPFFQFCQEQRSVTVEQLSGEQKEGETEPTKQDITKQLANKWNTLSPDEKKIYYAKYEQSRERYTTALLNYKRDKSQLPPEQLPSQST